MLQYSKALFTNVRVYFMEIWPNFELYGSLIRTPLHRSDYVTSVNLYGMLFYVKFHLKCIFKFILQWRYLTEKTLSARTQLNSTENLGRRCLTPLSPYHYYLLS